MTGIPGYDEWKLRSPDDQWERDTGRDLAEEEAAQENAEAMETFEEMGLRPIDDAPTDREITIVVKQRTDPDERAYEHVISRRAYCTWIDAFWGQALWQSVEKGIYRTFDTWTERDIIGWIPKDGEQPTPRPVRPWMTDAPPIRSTADIDDDIPF